MGEHAFSSAQQEGLYRAIYERRDVRSQFLPTPVPDEVLARPDSIREALHALRAEGGYYFATLMVTDISELTSLLLIDAEKDFVALLNYPRIGPGIYVLKDVLSRKKQLMPALIELVEKATEQ